MQSSLLPTTDYLQTRRSPYTDTGKYLIRGNLRPGGYARVNRIEYLELSGFFTVVMKVVKEFYSFYPDYLSIVTHYIDFKEIIDVGIKSASLN